MPSALMEHIQVRITWLGTGMLTFTTKRHNTKKVMLFGNTFASDVESGIIIINIGFIAPTGLCFHCVYVFIRLESIFTVSITV